MGKQKKTEKHSEDGKAAHNGEQDGSKHRVCAESAPRCFYVFSPAEPDAEHIAGVPPASRLIPRCVPTCFSEKFSIFFSKKT